ncbi:DUF2493 domain-containing protein [Rhizobium laguerreae]|uniref:DUF2493 domain-containing protein n=1 Tax=Rhizobium laguerreae TaxID=1076926 RepID=UPI001C91D5DF|nr:DUF2493 domain-containing protein [Rhizobium laguerreae]MBY3333777.1 DUF2493 domain-containing protein [Rhizobium laguerreae]
MRLVVTGGRDYRDTARIFEALDDLQARRPISVLIEGEADGLDKRAANWAFRRGVAVEKYPALWKLLGNSAGSRRNQQMIDEGKPDFGLVFPGGTGTADMRRRLVAAGIPFEEVAA